jgi:hypothetical protein
MAIIPNIIDNKIAWANRNRARELRGTETLKKIYSDGFNDFWSDGGVTALSALGTNAQKWFLASLEMVKCIQFSDQSFQPLPIPNKPNSNAPYVVVYNEDSSITIS